MTLLEIKSHERLSSGEVLVEEVVREVILAEDSCALQGFVSQRLKSG